MDTDVGENDLLSHLLVPSEIELIGPGQGDEMCCIFPCDVICLQCWGIPTYLHKNSSEDFIKHSLLKLNDVISRFGWVIPIINMENVETLRKIQLVLKSQANGFKHLVDNHRAIEMKFRDTFENWEEYCKGDTLVLMRFQRSSESSIPTGKSISMKLDNYAEDIGEQVLDVRTKLHTISAQSVLTSLEGTLSSVLLDRQDHIKRKTHQILRDITTIIDDMKEGFEREYEYIRETLKRIRKSIDLNEMKRRRVKMQIKILKHIIHNVENGVYEQERDGPLLFPLAELLTHMTGMLGRSSWNWQILQCDIFPKTSFNELMISDQIILAIPRSIRPGEEAFSSATTQRHLSNMVGNIIALSELDENGITTLYVSNSDIELADGSCGMTIIQEGKVSKPHIRLLHGETPDEEHLELYFYSEQENSIKRYFIEGGKLVDNGELYARMHNPTELDYSDLTKVYDLNDEGEIIHFDFTENTSVVVPRSLIDSPGSTPPRLTSIVPVVGSPASKSLLLCSDEDNNVWSVSNRGFMTLVKRLECNCISAVVVGPIRQRKSVLNNTILIDEEGKSYFRGRVFKYPDLFGSGGSCPCFYLCSTPDSTILGCYDEENCVINITSICCE